MLKKGTTKAKAPVGDGITLDPELNLRGCGHYKECSAPCEPFAMSSRGIPLYKCRYGGLFLQGQQIPELKRYTVTGTLKKLEE